MSVINKYLKESFRLIQNLNLPRKLTIQVGKTKSHSYNGNNLNIRKENNEFLFDVTTKIAKGVQDNKELEVNKQTEITLTCEKLKLFTSGKHFLYSNISYPDFENSNVENSELRKKVVGSITSISTQNKSYYKKKKFFRLILPLENVVRLRGDFVGVRYNVDDKLHSDALMQLNIAGGELHFFTFIDETKKSYFIIDSLIKLHIEEFQKIANSIRLGYAFLKGSYYGTEAYILSFDTVNHLIPDGILSIILGGGINNGFPVHSTKPYNIVQLRQKIKYKKNRDGQIIGLDTAPMEKYTVEFPNEPFSKLCDLINEKGGILRAVILFVSNNLATLELKVPTLFVALENITKVLIGTDKISNQLIENDTILKEIKGVIKATMKEISTIKKKYEPTNELEQKEYKANFERISNKLNDLNRGTNNKKLIEPFSRFGYNLSEEEENLIFIHRNKFLHGDDFISLDESYELEFKELFHISMRLHKLVAVLLLKASGYSGYILNNAKIHDNISEKKLKEKVFIKI